MENLNNIWLEAPSTRLSAWRQFRQNLSVDDIESSCREVINFWIHAPMVSLSIDPVDSTTWPTPWEMLHTNLICENSKALGMSYTFHYANPDIPNELIYIIDKNKCVERLCALIDNKHLLNFEHGAISTLPIENASITFRKKVSELNK